MVCQRHKLIKLKKKDRNVTLWTMIHKNRN
jgi:ribosomal protein L39E